MEKLWHRELKARSPKHETLEQQKIRQAKERKAARQKPFEQKESYRWVEALIAVENLFEQAENKSKAPRNQLPKTSESISPLIRIIHIFDREGDIAEVFDRLRQSEHTGVVVRAAHDRALDPEHGRLWEYISQQLIQFEQ